MPDDGHWIYQAACIFDVAQPEEMLVRRLLYFSQGFDVEYRPKGQRGRGSLLHGTARHEKGLHTLGRGTTGRCGMRARPCAQGHQQHPLRQQRVRWGLLAES